MIALQVKDVKNFMNKLLNSTTFDHYLMEEATIQTFNTFTIDGKLNRNFYSKEEQELLPFSSLDHSPWELIKPVIFQIIKGKKVPSLLKISLLFPHAEGVKILEEENLHDIASSLKYFVILIRYDSNGLRLTTGTSFSSFVLDKTPDTLWDSKVKEVLLQNNIDFDILS